MKIHAGSGSRRMGPRIQKKLLFRKAYLNACIDSSAMHCMAESDIDWIDLARHRTAYPCRVLERK